MRWPAVPLALLWSSLASGVTQPERSLSGRAAAADRVVLVRAGAPEVTLPGGDPRRMLTVTKVEVLADYQGQGPRAVEVVQLGGRSGPWERRLQGDAVFRAGERAVLFLRCRAPTRCALVGLARGKLELVEGPAPRVRVHGARGEEVRPLEDVVAELRAAATKRKEARR